MLLALINTKARLKSLYILYHCGRKGNGLWYINSTLVSYDKLPEVATCLVGIAREVEDPFLWVDKGDDLSFGFSIFSITVRMVCLWIRRDLIILADPTQPRPCQ